MRNSENFSPKIDEGNERKKPRKKIANKFVAAGLAVGLALAGCTEEKNPASNDDNTPLPSNTPTETVGGAFEPTATAAPIEDVLSFDDAVATAAQSTMTAQLPSNTPTETVGGAFEPTPTGEPTVETTNDGDWRVRQVQDISYGPELGHNRPGFGTDENQVGTVVGYNLSVITSDGEIFLGDGCQQLVLPPNTYARNAGGQDWGFASWLINPNETNYLDEMLVLTHQLATQQNEWEGCTIQGDKIPERVFVVVQDGEYVKLVPWNEYRRPTGEDAVLMFGPGDEVVGFHIGFGDSQDNVCDGGDCYISSAPTWGLVGGGVVNPWPEETEGMTPIDEGVIEEVLSSMDE